MVCRQPTAAILDCLLIAMGRKLAILAKEGMLVCHAIGLAIGTGSGIQEL